MTRKFVLAEQIQPGDTIVDPTIKLVVDTVTVGAEQVAAVGTIGEAEIVRFFPVGVEVFVLHAAEPPVEF